jgi:hypothetical protein
VKIGISGARRLDHQQLVATDAEMAIGNKTQLRGTQRNRRLCRIEYDEIIAETVHFGEFEFHRQISGRIYRQ